MKIFNFRLLFVYFTIIVILLCYLSLLFLIFSLQCLFCEKTFKDRPTLRDHMRKKQHKKINPKNKEFDKYYLINYLVGSPLYTCGMRIQRLIEPT